MKIIPYRVIWILTHGVFFCFFYNKWRTIALKENRVTTKPGGWTNEENQSKRQRRERISEGTRGRAIFVPANKITHPRGNLRRV